MTAVLTRVPNRRATASPRRARLAVAVQASPDVLVLRRYRTADGSRREVITVTAAGGSALVLDRCATDAGDPRVVAHLAADEPAINATVVCTRYLADRRSSRSWSLPRPLRPEDLLRAPLLDASLRADGDAASAGVACTTSTAFGTTSPRWPPPRSGFRRYGGCANHLRARSARRGS